MPAYNTYAPTPGVNFMSQDPSCTKIYGTLPRAHWEQWLSTAEGAPVAESTNMTASNVFAQEEPQRNYFHDPEISTQRDSPPTAMYSYPVPPPAKNPTILYIPINDPESRHGFSLTGSNKPKRKRSTTKLTACMPTRRASTKATKQETVPQKPKGRRSQTRPSSQSTEESSPQLDGEFDQCSKKIQERNRTASNKFRIKKREEAKKLQANEENMMQTNRKLLSSVLDLNQQI
jgi:hypothetical protein